MSRLRSISLGVLPCLPLPSRTAGGQDKPHGSSLACRVQVLGGGGYTKTTVARAWTLETGALPGRARQEWQLACLVAAERLPRTCGSTTVASVWACDSDSPSADQALQLCCTTSRWRTRCRSHRMAHKPLTHPRCSPVVVLSAAVLCDQPVEDALPQQMYLEYFSPDYRLNYNRRPVSLPNPTACECAQAATMHSINQDGQRPQPLNPSTLLPAVLAQPEQEGGGRTYQEHAA